MEKEFAIFDMDGTLVDSMPRWRGLVGEFLTSKGVTEVPDDIICRMKHRFMVESGEILRKEFHLDGTAESVAAELNGMMADHYRNDVKLKDGVAEYLEELRSRGVRMGVASATALPLVELCLKEHGIRDFFDSIHSCQTLWVNKEHPDVYHACARDLGGAPEDTAVYEDSLLASQTAKKAGYYTVGIYDSTGADEWDELQRTADESIFCYTAAI